MVTRSISRRRRRSWSRSMPKPARKHGRRRSMTTKRATTCRSRRSSSTARCCSARPAVNWACAVSSRRSMRRPASSCGRRTRSPRRASPEARPGRWAAITINAAAPRSGSRAPTTPRPTSASGAPATAARGSAISAPATISTPARLSPSMPPAARSKATSNIIPTIPGIGTKSRRRLSSVNVARDGYLWQLERTNDKINFIAGQPYVRQNVFKSLDPKTGRPDIDEARKPGTNKTAEFCPSLWGGKDWPPVAYSPQTRLLYIPANDNLCTELTGEAPKYVQGERFMGVAKNVMKMVADADHVDELQAWDLDTGKKAWTTNLPSFNLGPVLAPVRGLLFAGGTNDRIFRAFDAKTGKILWEFPTGSGVAAVPVSFEVDGKQYIAVQSGWGVDPAKMQARMNLIFPGKYPDVPQGGAIWVFAVN